MATPHDHSWHTFPAGARVLDTVTGQDGTVLKTDIQHSVQPAASGNPPGESGRLLSLPIPIVTESVQVKLDDGLTVQRSPRVLVKIR
jgi:hypothetical protein